jgi:nitronate monooxygenase
MTLDPFCNIPGPHALPVIVAPMFLISGPELVNACCKAGVIGSFPSINARTPELLEDWLLDIETSHAAARAARPEQTVAPYAVNLIMHPSNSRRDTDLAILVRHRVPLVIASVGNPGPAIGAIHHYGGKVYCDVATIKHARRAIEAGVDGLILLCAGAGGHTGRINPFAFLREVRSFFEGPIVLAGGITDGRAIRAAQLLGADGVYMGTRFLAAQESLASEDYKITLAASGADDIVLTTAVTGMPGNFLRSSLERYGLYPEHDGSQTFRIPGHESEGKRWRDIWSAGHGVGTVRTVEPAAEIVRTLIKEFDQSAG